MNTGTYYHFKIPPTYQAKKSFDHFTLYLDINSQNIVKGLFFTGPSDSPWLPVFSQLCRLCESKRLSNDFISQIRLPSPTPRWNLPLWLLRATYRDVLQMNHPHHQLTGYKAEDLVCRCFGVYLPQIQQFSSLKEVTDETRAGGGCSRCRPHIKRIVASSTRPPLVSEEDFKKIRVLTAVFIKQNFPSHRLELTNIDENRISVTFSGDEEKKDKIFQSVEKLIEYNFHIKVFLDSSY